MCYARKWAFEKAFNQFTWPQDGKLITIENYRRLLSKKQQKEFLLMVKNSEKASDTRQIFLVEGKLKKDWYRKTLLGLEERTYSILNKLSAKPSTKRAILGMSNVSMVSVGS